jgi:hypothetical protein
MYEQVSGAATRQWLAGQWLTDGSMDSVKEINTQSLEFLCEMAAPPTRRLPAMFTGQVHAWQDLTAVARAQLAASPYLLADAGFDDESRWLRLEKRVVRDLPRTLSEPAFVGAGAEDFVRRVLVLGWHLARANRQLARVVLGMTPACAERIAALRLQDLDWLAANQPGWVRPRWESQPRVWRHLLFAARNQDGELLTQVSLRGIQLMAANVLAGMWAPERRRNTLESQL